MSIKNFFNTPSAQQDLLNFISRMPVATDQDLMLLGEATNEAVKFGCRGWYHEDDKWTANHYSPVYFKRLASQGKDMILLGVQAIIDDLEHGSPTLFSSTESGDLKYPKGEPWPWPQVLDPGSAPSRDIFNQTSPRKVNTIHRMPSISA